MAWVAGTDDYATLVEMDTNGELLWQCTCPYDWGPCKHAVAVILAGLELLKSGNELPLVDEESELFLALEGGDHEEDDWFDDECDAGSRTGGQDDSAFEKLIRKKKKDELVELLTLIVSEYPEVRSMIMEEQQLATGRIDELVRSLRREIRDVTSEEAWYDHWNDRGELPDYSHIRKQLDALLKKGYADVVAELGEELWERGSDQVGRSHDDGYIAEEVFECMKIVFRAIRASSLPRAEQILKMINVALTDEYSICGSLDELLTGKKYSKADWLEVAEHLEKRLAAAKKPGGSFSAHYERTQLMEWLIRTWEKSGQSEKIIPLLEKEAGVTQCYERLVDTLIREGRLEDARSWCVRGYEKTIKSAPGIADGLQRRLREIAEREKRFDLAASYRAEQFFGYPCISLYQELQKAAEKIQEWPQVRAAVLHFLETGKRPRATAGQAGNRSWPLPPVEVKGEGDRRRHHRRYPDLETLIEIAILEKRTDDVVHLYRQQGETDPWGTGKGAKVADAVAATHPDVALDIWRRLAIDRIKLVKPKEYENAAVYLRRMRTVYAKTKKLDEWRQLLADLRAEHKAKRRLMEVLDSLENKRIID
ncbi:MAG: SWIM zinc finger family protein [Desulfobulbaceae bacterium]